MLMSQKDYGKSAQRSLIIILAFACLALFISCKKESTSGSTTPVQPTPPAGDSILAPLGFGFQTTRTVNISINLASNNNQPIPGVPVAIYAGDPTTTSPIAM